MMCKASGSLHVGKSNHANRLLSMGDSSLGFAQKPLLTCCFLIEIYGRTVCDITHQMIYSHM